MTEEMKEHLWCQICGRTITYETYKKNNGFYCDICNDILDQHIESLRNEWTDLTTPS